MASMNKQGLKGTVHTTISILSSFTHPEVIPNKFLLWKTKREKFISMLTFFYKASTCKRGSEGKKIYIYIYIG